MSKLEQEQKIVLKEDTDIFHLLDSEDEQQIIMEAQDRMKSALVYKVPWKNPQTNQYEERSDLSYAGIQHICIMMAQKHNEVGSLELVEDPKIEMQRLDLVMNGLSKTVIKWYASCKVRNTKTGMITPGISEADVVTKGIKRDPVTNKKVWDDSIKSYIYEEVYDDYGRTKAVSKAFRNACKIQIPQKLILEMIKIAEEKGQVKSVVNEQKLANCMCPLKDIIVSTTVRPDGLFECKHCSCAISEARKKALENFKGELKSSS